MDFCVNPSRFSFPGRLILLSSSPNLLINLPDWNNQNPQRKYTLYLWPRSKVWMWAHKASIQTAATKVTDIGDILSGGSGYSNPSKNNSTESHNHLMIPQIPPAINRIFLPSQNTALCKINKAYLWPRSKGWMRAHKASIQPAATKVTNMLYFGVHPVK